MKRAILPLALVASLGLAACSERAQNETAEAADTVAADVNATMGDAMNDVQAATDAAFGAAENGLDAAGNTIERTGEAITGDTADTGNQTAN